MSFAALNNAESQAFLSGEKQERVLYSAPRMVSRYRGRGRGWEKWYPRRWETQQVYRTCGVRSSEVCDDYSGYAELWREWQ